ncbi:MAG: ribonuclease Z [Lachnospiraceae bacterium]|jgi:ribonuclease Z|nr:ribonuclease Z [Lachnospiraceae bacterium]MEE3460840.1 ribonuclease Z [Lachnospiraceae bacterium]
MLDVCLLGTSGMMPLPGRYLTSALLRFNGSSLLIDAGEGTQVAIRSCGWSMNPIDTILITHFHGDHISGIGGLLLSMANSDRKDPVRIIGPKGLKDVIRCLLVIAPSLPFALEYTELEEPIETFAIKGMNITAFRVYHNVTCYGYSIEVPRGGEFFPEKAKALNIPLKYWNPLQKGNTVEDPDNGQVYTPDMVLGEKRKGIKVTYCTDSRPVDRIRECAEGSDLFICEGMYGDTEKAADAKEKKHMTMQEGAYLASDAHVRELWFTHYSPSMTHPEHYIGEIRKIFPSAKASKDGRWKTINFED